MSFAENLKRLRKERGLTQDQLAKQIGLGKRAVIYYEAGGHYPKNHETYQKIADVLGCTTDDLLSENDQFIAKAQEKYGARGRKQAEDAVLVDSSEMNIDQVVEAIRSIYEEKKGC